MAVLAVVVSAIAVAVSGVTAWRQHQLAVAHAGAQSAIAWRNQVLDLHDRGLEPERSDGSCTAKTAATDMNPVTA